LNFENHRKCVPLGSDSPYTANSSKRIKRFNI
jgi:hypothetical protein